MRNLGIAKCPKLLLLFGVLYDQARVSVVPEGVGDRGPLEKGWQSSCEKMSVIAIVGSRH